MMRLSHPQRRNLNPPSGFSIVPKKTDADQGHGSVEDDAPMPTFPSWPFLTRNTC